MPPLDSTSWSPLLLAGLLVAALAFQMLAIDDDELPSAAPIDRVGVVASGALPPMTPATGAGVVIARSMFAPGRQAGQPGVAATSPLGGLKVAGSMRIGRAQYAVVQNPGGRASYVRVGGRVGDWRLVEIASTEALLRRGDERLTVPFGGQGVSTNSAGEEGAR